MIDAIRKQISKEGLDGTVSGKSKSISLTRRKIKNLFSITNFDSENLSKSKFQPFHRPKIKIKKEVVPMGFDISTKIKKTNRVEPSKWNNLIKDKNTFILDARKPFEFEADNYSAKTLGDTKHMILGLKKLTVENLGNLTPHPLNVFLNYSHPPVLDRIKALKILTIH